MRDRLYDSAPAIIITLAWAISLIALVARYPNWIGP